MLGMPVERNAVATSPQLTWIVGFSPSPKSHDPLSGCSRETMRPLRRKRVPAVIASIMVLAVPRDIFAPSEIEYEVFGVRQSAFQMRRKAIAGHDVEANAGQKRYPSRLGFGSLPSSL